MLEGFFTAAGTLLLVAAILVLCYYTTRRLGKLQMGGGGGRYIRMLDHIAVGQDKAVVLIQTGEKYLLLGVANSQISVLSELEESQITELEMYREKPGDFRNILEALKDRKK